MEEDLQNSPEVTPETSTGLEPNVAGALCYLLGILTGILFYVLEKENEFVRFHAMQSIIVFGGIFVLSVLWTAVMGIIGLVPILGWIVVFFLGLISLLFVPVIIILWVFLMYKAFTGKMYSVPLVGKYARQYM